MDGNIQNRDQLWQDIPFKESKCDGILMPIALPMLLSNCFKPKKIEFFNLNIF